MEMDKMKRKAGTLELLLNITEKMMWLGGLLMIAIFFRLSSIPSSGRSNCCIPRYSYFSNTHLVYHFPIAPVNDLPPQIQFNRPSIRFMIRLLHFTQRTQYQDRRSDGRRLCPQDARSKRHSRRVRVALQPLYLHLGNPALRADQNSDRQSVLIL